MRRLGALLFLAFLLASPASPQKSEREQLFDRLAKDLKSRDAATRLQAVDTLGRLKVPEVIELLAFALGDKDAGVREEAARSLWNAGDIAKPAMPALRNALQDPAPAVVIRAAGALIAMDVSPNEIADPLRGVLQKGDTTDRFLAARALIPVDSGATLVAPIIDYLKLNASNRDNFELGEKALASLAERQDPAVTSLLLARLRDTSQIAHPILAALGTINPRPEGWIDVLVGQLASTNAEVRELALELLGKQTSNAKSVSAWAPAAARLVTDPQPAVRREALDSLGKAQGLAIDSLGAALAAVKSDKDAGIRARAAAIVGEIADAAFAIDESKKVAAAEQAFPVLTAAISSDAALEVRRAALRSLDRLQLDAAKVVPLLARIAVEGKDLEMRSTALRGIKDRGRDAASAEETIKPLLNDPEESLRLEAQWTIDAMKSASRMTKTTVSVGAAVDPAARERALETLREYHVKFDEESFYLSINDVEPEIITAFLDAGMSPNHRFASMFGEPPLRTLLRASEGCSAGVRPTSDTTKALVKLLLSRGAEPNLADENGSTILMAAVENCDPEIVKTLLAAKADMNAKSKADLTAFEFGIWGMTDGAATLVAAGFRLSAEKAKIYLDAYKDEPKKLAFVKKAIKTAAAKKK
ncbi:MAG TPA: HEAT repeat domain-containing protein [Thermoanaerobaculia bacterium]